MPAAYEVVAPKLAMVGNTVHLVWSDRRSGSYEPFAKRSLDGGATWLPPETRLNGSVAAGAGYALGAEVVASPDLTAAVWIESRPISSPREIYLNRSLDDGATWSPTELRLSQTGSPSLKLFAKVGIEMDTTHTIWAEDTVMTLRHAIASGYLAYGSGTPGAGNIVPRVRGSGVPGIGATFTIAVEEGAGGVFGLLAAGFGAGSRTAVPMFGGTMLVQPTAIFGLLLGGAGPGTGSASLPVAVPSDVALLGLSINWQALLLDPAGPMGVTLTNGLELWIG